MLGIHAMGVSLSDNARIRAILQQRPFRRLPQTVQAHIKDHGLMAVPDPLVLQLVHDHNEQRGKDRASRSELHKHRRGILQSHIHMSSP